MKKNEIPSWGWASFRFCGDIISFFSCISISSIVCSLFQSASMGNKLGSTWKWTAEKLSRKGYDHIYVYMYICFLWKGNTYHSTVMINTAHIYASLKPYSRRLIGIVLPAEQFQLVDTSFMYSLAFGNIMSVTQSIFPHSNDNKEQED